MLGSAPVLSSCKPLYWNCLLCLCASDLTCQCTQAKSFHEGRNTQHIAIHSLKQAYCTGTHSDNNNKNTHPFQKNDSSARSMSFNTMVLVPQLRETDINPEQQQQPVQACWFHLISSQIARAPGVFETHLSQCLCITYISTGSIFSLHLVLANILPPAKIPC